MEAEASDHLSAYMLEQDIASGPHFEQPWHRYRTNDTHHFRRHECVQGAEFL
jgi:hypothetical protein